jgi:hypothetical protein
MVVARNKGRGWGRFVKVEVEVEVGACTGTGSGEEPRMLPGADVASKGSEMVEGGVTSVACGCGAARAGKLAEVMALRCEVSSKSPAFSAVNFAVG